MALSTRAINGTARGMQRAGRVAHPKPFSGSRRVVVRAAEEEEAPAAEAPAATVEAESFTFNLNE